MRLTAAQRVGACPRSAKCSIYPGSVDGGERGTLSPGVLVEFAEPALLLQTRTLAAAGAITSDGWPEWVECLGAADRVPAGLYLLQIRIAWPGMPCRRAPALRWRSGRG